MFTRFVVFSADGGFDTSLIAQYLNQIFKSDQILKDSLDTIYYFSQLSYGHIIQILIYTLFKAIYERINKCYTNSLNKTLNILPVGMGSDLRRHVKQVLERSSPYLDPNPESSCVIIDYLLNQCKVLVIGAGGLGCELLKDLALMGFRDIQIIDMDTIELSNLNRQFLFQTEDIGKPKANVAAEFIAQYIPDCQVIAHHAKIQDFDTRFYEKFNIVICGLDSIEARRWINKMMVDILRYDNSGNLDQTSVIPLIDGGTEGLKGNARVILPGITACIECNLDLYPPPVAYPLCTIANKPRLPEHCIEYVRLLLWSREEPFGRGVPLDKDDPQHIQWINKKSVERAREYNIEPPNLRFTQGVVKRTIPAVSSTNACIAALCAMESFKLVTSCAKVMNNFQIINLSSGFYSYTFEAEKDDNCLVCSRNSLEVVASSR